MPKGKGRQDPLGNYIEWAHHRYDPGHFSAEQSNRISVSHPLGRERGGLAASCCWSAD
jgi:hypothetical protein